MSIPLSDNLDVYIGFGLFILSEIIGMSKAKDNSVLQLVVHLARELFPYENRKTPPSRHNRPRFPRGR
jgi:hypothetical protein